MSGRPASRSRRDPRPDAYDIDGEVVAVRRSARRRRTVSARREAGRLVVMVPATLSAAEEHRFVEQLSRKMRDREHRGHAGDSALETRAAELSELYLGGRGVPTSVRWSTRQRRRWGSCTPATGEIRISEHARGLPDDVFDYLLLHELAHLLVEGHGPRFWAELAGYPDLERARGFLDGVAYAQDQGLTR